ncbi:hypothetical protein GGR09_001774, partial [Bartonella heixiaziensis]
LQTQIVTLLCFFFDFDFTLHPKRIIRQTHNEVTSRCATSVFNKIEKRKLIVDYD